MLLKAADKLPMNGRVFHLAVGRSSLFASSLDEGLSKCVVSNSFSFLMVRTKVTTRMGINQRRVLSLEEEGRQAAACVGLTHPGDRRPTRECNRSPPPLPRRSPRMHPGESSSSLAASAPRPVATLESLSDSIYALRSSLCDGIMVTDWRVTCMIDYIFDMNFSLIRCHTAMNKLALEVQNMQSHPPGFSRKDAAASFHEDPLPEAETSKRAAIARIPLLQPKK